MELQTAVVDDSEVTNVEIDEPSKFDHFKQMMADLNVMRLAVYQKMLAVDTDISNLEYSYSDILSMFQTEAVSMYPELGGQDVGQVMSQLSEAHPLLQLWSQYVEKLSAIDQDLNDLISYYDQLVAMDDVLAAEEQSVFDGYGVFQANAKMRFPTPQELYQTITAEGYIPSVEAGSTIADLSAIELLSPNAADMVTLQTTNNENPEVFQDMLQTGVVAKSATDKAAQEKNYRMLAVAAVIAFFVLGNK